jgi:monofunctional biosynthetic peptidoglycan transglycosylase
VARRPQRRIWLALALGSLLPVMMAGALWVSVPNVAPLARTPPRTTAFIELRRAEAAAAKRKFNLRWSWRPLAQITPLLREAVVLTEDAKFWKHDGVDWEAVENAAEKNLVKRRIGLGGSTITQQLAKNLFLSPSKNPVRKLRELLIARRLEAQLPKERLLELYLNVAEWGDGVFGAEAASRQWFGVAASALTPVQAARLALALPNPRKRSPAVKSRALDRRAAGLVEVMRRRGLITQPAGDEALRALQPTTPAPSIEQDLEADPDVDVD